jgi:hypothetical protein
VPDLVVVRGTDEPALESLVGLTVLTQANEFGEPGIARGVAGSTSRLVPAVTTLLDEGISGVTQSWQEAVNMLFGLEKWLENLPLPAVGARLLPDGASQDAGEASRAEAHVSPQVDVPEAAATPAGEWSGAATLAAAVAAFTGPRASRRGAARQRRWQGLD